MTTKENRKAWDDRSEQRNEVLARYGLTLEQDSFGYRLRGDMADTWKRMARLDFNSYDGWKVATTGSIWEPHEAEEMLRQMTEVLACVNEPLAIGDVTGPLN